MEDRAALVSFYRFQAKTLIHIAVPTRGSMSPWATAMWPFANRFRNAIRLEDYRGMFNRRVGCGRITGYADIGENLRTSALATTRQQCVCAQICMFLDFREDDMSQHGGHAALYTSRPMNSRRLLRSQIFGWIAVSISTALACFWAVWGINENFHEGWYFESVWRNIGLMMVQYLSPMLGVILLSVIAILWPRFALPTLGIVAIGAAWFFRKGSAGTELIAGSLLVLGTLYTLGRPHPRHWALGGLFVLPVLTIIVCGAYPWWQAFHRLDDGNYGMRQVEGNNLTLVWAPEGPGWPTQGSSWQKATDACEHLTKDGRSESSLPQGVWRLPSVDEAVRSLVYRGHNAGGTWDSVHQSAHFRVPPDKDFPLWKVHSQVIYWWTATEVDHQTADYITNNGAVHSHDKRSAGDYTAFRCVCERWKQVPPAPINEVERQAIR